MKVGIDIVDVERIKRLMDHYGVKFLDKIFSHEEKAFFENKRLRPESIAGRFALKEAFIKAMGTKISFRDIKILYSKGKPYIEFKGILYEGVSISHERTFAVGIVVASKENIKL